MTTQQNDASLQSLIDELIEAHKASTQGEMSVDPVKTGYVGIASTEYYIESDTANVPDKDIGKFWNGEGDARFFVLSHNNLIPILEALRGRVEGLEKLEKVAVLSAKLLDLMNEFPEDPSAYGEYVEALQDAINAIGDERLAEMKWGKR